MKMSESLARGVAGRIGETLAGKGMGKCHARKEIVS